MGTHVHPGPDLGAADGIAAPEGDVARSGFSFLDGASHPEELVLRAKVPYRQHWGPDDRRNRGGALAYLQ